MVPRLGQVKVQTTVSIGEVARRTGLSIHAVRLYENRGMLISCPQRDPGGRRVYTEDDVAWLVNCCLFRSSGMPLADIARFADLVREGPGNEAERLRLLQEHQQRIAEQTAALKAANQLIEAKVNTYSQHLAEGSAAALWTGSG